jgi:hypothetical protein
VRSGFDFGDVEPSDGVVPLSRQRRSQADPEIIKNLPCPRRLDPCLADDLRQQLLFARYRSHASAPRPLAQRCQPLAGLLPDRTKLLTQSGAGVVALQVLPLAQRRAA